MEIAASGDSDGLDWRETVFQQLKRGDIRQLFYVPDAGHSHVIRRAHEDPDIIACLLTTEEEGVAAAAGAWLGGDKAVLLMQSSGVGNCINMLSLISNCRFPFLTLVTMRGEHAEFNPWQVPMARATASAMELMGLSVRRVDAPRDVGPMVEAALDDAFVAEQGVTVLLGQRLQGRKVWTK